MICGEEHLKGRAVIFQLYKDKREGLIELAVITLASEPRHSNSLARVKEYIYL
jgi:hypothetical protein